MLLSGVMFTPSHAPSPEFTFGGYAQQPSLAGVPFWPRAAARIVDTLLHIIVATLTGAFIGILIAVIAMAKHANVQQALAPFRQATIFSFVTSLVGTLLYHTVCEGLHGSSLGKLIFGQVVLSIDNKPCDFTSALKRSTAYFLDSLFFGAVGYFEMQKTDLHQRHGDNWANTFVCKRSEAPQDVVRGAGRFVGVFLLALCADAICLAIGLIAKAF